MMESGPTGPTTIRGLGSVDSGERLEPPAWERCCSVDSTRPPLEPRRSISRPIAYVEIICSARTFRDYARSDKRPITAFKQGEAGRIPAFRIGTSVQFDPRAVAQCLRRS